jgi:hypothetical protein
VYKWSQQKDSPTTKTITVGVENSTSATNTTKWQFEISVGFKAGYELKGVSGGVSVDANHSSGGENAVTNALSRTKLDQVSKTFNKSGSYWQFIAHVGAPSGCMAGDIYTEEFMHTPNSNQPPCCPPGTFKDIDKATGACVDPKLRICK